MHPRRTRLGLIEAGPSFGAALVVSGAHPRRTRLGLIEALRRHFKVFAGTARIRGARASASLKPGEPRGRRAAASSHPRRTRLGLIEARFHPHSAAAAAMHPRRTRLGLIEATTRWPMP